MVPRFACASVLLLVALGLAPSRSAVAQSNLPTFTEVKGTANPLGVLDVPNIGVPSFVDLNGDGTTDFVFSPAEITPFPSVVRGGTRLLLFDGVPGDRTSFVPADSNPLATLPLDGAGGLPSFGDLDGDGDLDLVIVATQDGFVYFENTGSSAVPTFVRRDGAANPFVSVALGALTLVDLDGDGDLDAVSSVSGEDGADVRYFENVGGVNTPVFTEAASPFADLSFPSVVFPLAFADVDGDGDLDAAAGEVAFDFENGQTVSLRLLLNTGSAAAAAFAPAPSTALEGLVFEPFQDEFASPAFADLDGDGAPDLVVSRGVNIVAETVFLRNVSVQGVAAFTVKPGFENPVRLRTPIDDVIVPSTSGDLDGDGDLDLVVGTSSETSPVYLENVGGAERASFLSRSGAENPFRVLVTTIDETVAPMLGDLDGDGDLDAVFAGADFEEFVGRIVYLENTGTASMPAFTRRTGTANPFDGLGVELATSGALVDLDGDGDLDLALASSNNAFESELLYFENTGSATAPTFTARTGSASPLPVLEGTAYRSLAFGDMDNDGDADLLLAEVSLQSEVAAGTIRTFENVGSPSAAVLAERTADANPFAGAFFLPVQPTVADFNGDGDADVIVGSLRIGEDVDGESAFLGNTFRFFLNDGTAPVAVDPGAPTAGGFALSAAYPNPFADEARFILQNDREQPVTVIVYDALGRRVAVLHDGSLAAGEHTLRFDGTTLAAGLFVVDARSAYGIVAQRVTRVR